MNRREIIAGLGSVAAWPVVARAQQDGRVRHIGLLMPFEENEPIVKSRISAFIQALAGLGWTDGRNVQMDFRWHGDDASRVGALAQELVSLQPDIILTNGNPATAALQRETRTNPIVFVNVSDPVATGNVERLDRPSAPASPPWNARWEASGLSCSRRSLPDSSESQSCSIPTRPP